MEMKEKLRQLIDEILDESSNLSEKYMTIVEGEVVHDVAKYEKEMNAFVDKKIESFLKK